MKPLYRYLAMGMMIAAAAVLQLSQYQKARLEDCRGQGSVLEAAIAGQHDWNMHNGKKISVRIQIITILSAVKDSLHHDPALLADLIIAKADEHRIDPYLVLGVIKTESEFNRFAISPKGAVGLMQIRPHTAAALYDGEPAEVEAAVLTDNELNISLGTRYLARLLRRFGDLDLALEAYNRGPTRLRRDLNDGAEVDRFYAGKVMANYRQMRKVSASRTL